MGALIVPRIADSPKVLPPRSRHAERRAALVPGPRQAISAAVLVGPRFSRCPRVAKASGTETRAL
eukprot:9473245-Pyramimonas_sp.AAC.1